MTEPNPLLLSVVMVGRNDNYGGDFAERLLRCLRNTVDGLDRARIRAEVIFVNYNPLPEPKIEDFITWPSSTDHVSMCVLTIPPSVHGEMVKSGVRKNLPVLEYVAKNAGIRRAEGEYVLCMNPDILIPEEFFTQFKGLVKKNCYYRTNRYDFQMPERDEGAGSIKNLVTKVWVQDFAYEQPPGPVNRWKLRKIRALQQWYFLGYRIRTLFAPLYRLIWNVHYHPKAEMTYHCNGSGDFMLMHRDHWAALKGHNEQTYLALHVDGLMVIQAAALGLREEILPWPVYHQEHERRFNALEKRPEYISAYQNFQRDAQDMLRARRAKVYNDENWGLATFDLSKTVM